MNILVIHNTCRYLGGAETVLGYLLGGSAAAQGSHWTVAIGSDSRVAELVPSSMRAVVIPGNEDARPIRLLQQLMALWRAHRRQRFDAIHAWAARDWELASLLGRWIRRPAVGTLHDHPRARYHSPRRQQLMRRCAGWGLSRVVCVSHALREACAEAGYPRERLTVIHNGLPWPAGSAGARREGECRIGYLGVFSELKGLPWLFELADGLAAQVGGGWEWVIGGAAQDDDGRNMVASIQERYQGRPWWSRVRWIGWVERRFEFLRSLDLLVFPTQEFDCLPTVLIEAGACGVPVLASRRGGVPEIVADGETGWLMDPGATAAAVEVLSRLVRDPAARWAASQRAMARARDEFALEKMVARYGQLYCSLAS
ncbi:MAG TPA: glycosyltransferase family 4 protein [Candidatus Paceibacterota bacterium]|nr:glycosyltransferase family 4 protein [Verrucomicrobiota bacterium]HRZ46510.1 glycosyltransferase family 4 protein [Candidatus Paceibacterota bacterium]HRZ93071.1 glycosyltransferase family 4 protein [Candidatus Paceibacterota bacterium]